MIPFFLYSLKELLLREHTGPAEQKAGAAESQLWQILSNQAQGGESCSHHYLQLRV